MYSEPVYGGVSLNFRDVVRDFVFGMQDGLVSNLGLVLGVWHGGGTPHVILLAGLASMFSGAFSMSAGSYLSAKSQRQVYEHEIAHAKRELKENPKRALREMKQILKEEKFDADEVKALLHHFEHHNHSTFTVNYLQKKVGLSEERLELPVKNAVAMFLSFLVGSLFPILPFILFDGYVAAGVAVVGTAAALFFVGWAKNIYTKLNWLRSGAEIAIVGIGAGLIGYLVGSLFG